RIFDQTLKVATPAEPALRFPPRFEGKESEWARLLSAHGFRDAHKAFRVLREFVEGPGYVHVSPRTRELAYQLLPKLFTGSDPGRARPQARGRKSGAPAALRLSDPDRVVMRLDSFIGAYGARATLFELWNSNPAIFELLVLLFDRSEFLAELAIRQPDLV